MMSKKNVNDKFLVHMILHTFKNTFYQCTSHHLYQNSLSYASSTRETKVLGKLNNVSDVANIRHLILRFIFHTKEEARK